MAGTNVGTAYLEILPSAKGFAGKLQSEVGGGMGAAGEKAGKSYGGGLSRGLKRLGGAALGLVAVSKVTGFLKDANAEARESQKVGARTANVIRTTGGIANVTADQVGKLSTAISNKSGIDDEAIQTGSNLLLTFKNVRNEVGKGANIFDRATQAAVDLSASGFGDINGASKQLGKALNDPIKGISALGRAGVTFTDQQKFSIKWLVKNNKTLEAQKIILKEVESQVGGSAAAQATAGEKARVSFDNLKETIGTALLPVVDKLSVFVTDELAPGVTKFVTGMQDGTGAGGDFADVLKDVVSVGKGILGFFNGLPGPVKKYGAELLIAAVVLSKVNSGLVGLRTRMATTGAEGGRFGRTMRGVGAGLRNLAGAGGALAAMDGLKRLNKSSSESQKALGGLELAAGSAAVGFAVGGPLGAAIGGTIGSGVALVKTFGLFGTAAKKNQGPLKVSAQTLQDYAGTLDQTTGATTRATRAMVLQRLESSGLLASTRKLGLSDREAVNAMTGNKAAREKLSHALRTTTKLTDDQREALRVETGAVGASRLKQLQHNIAIADSATELKNARTKLRLFMKEPANKRVGITGVEDVVGKLNSIRAALNEVFNLTPPKGKTSGPGGIGVLLNLEGAGATGAIVNRPTLALIGESGPEMLTPLNRTRGNGPLPAAVAGQTSGRQQLYLVLDDGTQFSGYVDNRIGAHSGTVGMIRRAR